ncbi:hypothetical protein CFN78_09755 [Amycolatopsis antarctica]|uniref:Uncharacterized protein n=1 Tax=Amycolatopsis antarctica TaxID=1854586 RepID=A0A263D6E4_9PSEU|nr:hypothetical protein [Amycolatopsis antarctica]OZM73157.1 hypothetical protein CFN78_09755 [Amycolatopsis antarctica]
MNDTLVTDRAPSGRSAPLGRLAAAALGAGTALFAWPVLAFLLVAIVDAVHGDRYAGAAQFVLIIYGFFGWPVIAAVAAVLGGACGTRTGGRVAVRGLLPVAAGIAAMLVLTLLASS